jgi:beta-phosphoglucomutase family hydrolase
MAPYPFDAVLFDLDGVLTSTTELHAAAWKQTFDELLDEPFDLAHDYVAYVDGKPRGDGVRDFMRSRGFAASDETVQEIGDRKQALFEQALAGGIDAYPGSVRWVEHLRGHGVHTAVVSSSKNADAVLRSAGISDLFELTVSGRDVAELGLRGKPAPDAFLEAAERLSVLPRNAIVVEDALAGVAAGRRGHFGLVIGVARGAARAELRAAGADVVVDDLQELVP